MGNKCCLMLDGNMDSTGANATTPGPMGGALIDLQVLVEDYCWEHFRDIQVASKKHDWKGLDRDDIHFEIDIKKLSIIHDEASYDNFHPTASKPWTLFKTVFTNNTDRDQQYSFKTERTTESTCSIIKEQGYCIGEEAEFKLKTPCEIFEASAGFKHEISFNKSNENTKSEVLTWGVDSNIVVPAKCQTSAELVVEEMAYAGKFNVTTHMSGRVTCSLIRRTSGQLLLPIVCNIAEVVREQMQVKQNKTLKQLAKIDQQVVHLETRGMCAFQFAMKQRVTLNEEYQTQKKLIYETR